MGPLALLAKPAGMAVMAGVSALMPLISEIFRDKPDPEAAKTLVMSKRQEMVDRAIGSGMKPDAAEKQVDAQIQAAMEEADRQGHFNTPYGEMIAGALLGGLGGLAVGKVGGAAAKLMGKGKDAAKAAATGGSAAAGSEGAAAVASRVGDMDDVAKAATSKAPIEVTAEVLPGPFPGRTPMRPPEVPMSARREWVAESPFPSPGVVRGQGFTMREGGTQRLSASPEILNEIERERMMGRLYGRQGY